MVKIKKIFIISLISGFLISLFAKVLFDLNIVTFILFFVGTLVCSIIGVLVYILSGNLKADKEKEIKDSILKDEEELFDEISKLKKDLLIADQPVASEQSEKLLLLLNDFRRVVKEKLGSSTITHSSYITESERVFNLVRQNLKDILIADISIETVEERYGSNIPEDDLDIVEKQRKYILNIIESNKELLKALNVISVEVANIKDIGSFEYDESLNRLKELTERAKQYSKK
ncbi:MAG: hypothetical protein OCD02_03345 [Spirochaetaceae bacterium]